MNLVYLRFWIVAGLRVVESHDPWFVHRGEIELEVRALKHFGRTGYAGEEARIPSNADWKPFN